MNTSIGDYARGGDFGGNAVEQREGPVARAIETRTSKLPSDLFLWAAGAAVLGSLAFQVIGMTRKVNHVGSFFGGINAQPKAPLSTFIGQWAPTLLLLGVYNKIVKVAGSDRLTR